MTRGTCAAGLLATFLTAGTLHAQSVPEVKLPASPRGSAEVQVGGTWAKTQEGGQRYEGGKWITVDYGRPVLRGRENIFGSGADYGRTVAGEDAVWRAGANATTRLSTQVPLDMGGTQVPPGTYNVFVDLKPGAWALVLSTQPIQERDDPNDKVKLYGAYNYDPKFDVVRLPMKVSTSPVSVEQFTIGFVDVKGDRASLAMWWDTTVAVAEFRIR